MFYFRVGVVHILQLPFRHHKFTLSGASGRPVTCARVTRVTYARASRVTCARVGA